MNKLLISICLCLALISIYGEYLWLKHNYRSLVLVASKCPKPSMIEQTRKINPLFIWFKSSTDPSFAPVTCETVEIHTDPRSMFSLIKFVCLITVIWPLLSHVHQRAQRRQRTIRSIGDGLQSETVKEPIGLRTKITIVEKHR